MTVPLKKMAPFIIYQYIGHQKEEGAAEYLPFPQLNDEGPVLSGCPLLLCAHGPAGHGWQRFMALFSILAVFYFLSRDVSRLWRDGPSMSCLVPMITFSQLFDHLSALLPSVKMNVSG